MENKNNYIREEVTFLGKFSGSVFQTIKLSFLEFKWRVISLLIMGLFARILLLSTANVMGKWADSICAVNSDCRQFAYNHSGGYGNSFYLYLLIGIVCFGFILNTAFRILISRTGSRAVSLLYDEVTSRTSRLPMSFFDTTPVGRMMSRFSSDYGSIFRMAGGPLGEFLCLVFDLIAIAALMLLASIWFVPIVILVIVLNYFAYRVNNPILREERRIMSKVRGPAIAHFAETVQGYTPIRVYGKSENFLVRYNELLGVVSLEKIRVMLVMLVYNFQMSLITSFVLLLTSGIGLVLVSKSMLSVGTLGVALTFIMMASNTIQQFFEWLANLEEALTGVERMDEYLRKDIELGSRLPLDTKFKLNQPIEVGASDKKSYLHTFERREKGAFIEVDRLSLRYREDLPMVLKDLNFNVESGSHFAIVGRTGSGKSSLIQAMFMIYQPTLGHIKIDGKLPNLSMKDSTNENYLNLDDFRSLMSLIPQDPILFSGTIRNNLSCDPALSDDKIWESLENVGIASWVYKLKALSGSALDFEVNERGGNLSTGERQLLCMTRALLQNRPIIIMDEATSSIDPASEKLLMRALEDTLKDKTRVVVAHRLSTIETSDYVLTLENGSIKELIKQKH